MVPITGWARSFLLFQKQNGEEGETEYKQQAYQFTQGYNILHRLQVHHPILTFIIHNKYTRNVLLSAQMGERASVVLICIITSRYNEVK